ncbi:MAG: uroporphyrinogen-III synthase [Burkholderiaceae bacterium]
MRLVITQSTARIAILRARLAERGHDSLLLPFSTITDSPSAPDPASLRAAIAAHDRVVPVSPTAVERMLAACTDAGSGRRDWPPATRLAVVGPGSLRALAADLPPPVLAGVIRPASAPFDADHLIDEPALRDCAGLRVLVLRGETGSDRWIDTLRRRGALVTVLSLYRNVPLEPGDAGRESLRAWLARAPADGVTDGAADGGLDGVPAGGPDEVPDGIPDVCWLFNQTAIAVRCCAWLRATGQSSLADRHRALAIHPRIAQALSGQGWRQVSLIEPGEASLLAAIESSG